MSERIEIIVTTDADTAAGTLDALADQVEDLTGLRPEITVQADTGDAAGGLDDLAATADDVDGTAVAVDVSAPGASDAVSDIDAVTAAADGAAEAADAIGPAAEGSAGSVKGAAKDMLRPLGLAKSQVGDLTDAFQFLSDQVTSNMNLSKEQVGKLAAALPAIGVAIGLAVSMWSQYNAEQKKAAEEADKLRDAYREVGDALAQGDPVAAAEALTAANQDLFDSAADLGVPYQQLTDYITGAADSIPAMEDATGELGSATANLAIGAIGARDAFNTAAEGAGAMGDKADAAAGSIDTYAESVGGAVDAAADLAGFLEQVNAALDIQASRVDVAAAIDTVEASLAAAAAAAFEFGAGSEQASDANRDLQGDLIDAKQDVLDYAESVGTIPPEKLSRILALIDQGKLTEAERALDTAARDRTSTIAVKAYLERIGNWGFSGVSGFGRAAAPQAAGTTAMAAGPTAMAAPAAYGAAPTVTVRVDARGTIDPYSVGLAVERAAGAWGRVSGQWRPGQRAGAG